MVCGSNAMDPMMFLELSDETIGKKLEQAELSCLKEIISSGAQIFLSEYQVLGRTRRTCSEIPGIRQNTKGFVRDADVQNASSLFGVENLIKP